MLFEQRLVHGAQQNKDTDQDDDPGDGAGQDIDGCFHQGITGHDGVCAAEVGLADDAQNQTEDHGRAVELAGGEDEADEAGDGHQDTMNQFYNQMFNPTYVNQSFYQSIPSQTMWQYQQDQNAEVQKAVKATRDLCEAVNKLDAEHQQQAFYACLMVLASELGWNN